MEGEESLRGTLNKIVSGLSVEEKYRERLKEFLKQWMSTITPDLGLKNTDTVHNKNPQRKKQRVRKAVEGCLNKLMSTALLTQETKDEYAPQHYLSLADSERESKDEEEEDEYATVYFCPASDGYWYAIPPRLREVKAQGDILTPVFGQPFFPRHFSVLPFTLGPYLVLICCPQENNIIYEQEWKVYYMDVTKGDPATIFWVHAPSFIGSKMCVFFVANNYKIYGLECCKDDKISLKSLDFHYLEEGWEEECQSASPMGYNISPHLFPENVVAFKLQCEEDSNTSSQVPVRAFIFTHDCCICYDFTKNAVSLSKEVFRGDPRPVYSHCKGVFVGNTMYVLVNAITYHYFMAYNPRDDGTYCRLTQVTGLDKDGIFPSCSPYKDIPPRPARLLHLGKSRLCILWCRLTARRTTEVHCTKFDVCENRGKHFAENVSTEVYNVIASGDWRMDALAYCSSKTTAL